MIPELTLWQALRLSPDAWLTRAARVARWHRISPLYYKCSARSAVAARRRGWAVLPVSDEALLHPADFSLEGPACRQLRRRRRKAEAAGVRITEAGHVLPLAEMAEISADWSRANGGERGCSMGRFDTGYLQGQRIFLAYQGDRLLAFASFNEVAAEWSLDLMRQTATTPDGTTHALVAQAIARAATCDCPRLSLASVPRDTALQAVLPERLQTRLTAVTGAAGLRRFTSSFAPEWRPLCAAAPNRFRLILGLAEVARSINSSKRRPAPAPTIA